VKAEALKGNAATDALRNGKVMQYLLLLVTQQALLLN
jgi:hypothetical protein